MDDLTRESFCLDLIRDVTGLLEDTVGLDEAEGYLSLVGRMMGERIYALYGHGPDAPLPPEGISGVLIDLKARIGGAFRLHSADDTALVFVNDRCPFGARVMGRPSLCMMTSNVFGSIAAESAGFAQVALERTIAAGDGHCRVVVRFDRAEGAGRAYYRGPDARE